MTSSSAPERATASAAAALLLVLTGCGSARADGAPTSGLVGRPSAASSTAAPAAAAPWPFGARSVWRYDVRAARVDPSSARVVPALVRQVTSRYNGVAALNAYRYSTTFVTAPPSTRRVDVRFDDCQRKGRVPGQLYDPAHGAHFRSVPIPTWAVPSPGTDAELTVWDPRTDQLWEFWKARRAIDGWYACWGGRIDAVSRGPGRFVAPMGATATGLPNAGGMVSARDLARGSIDHAVALQLPEVDHWDVVSWPASRSDGSNPSRAADRVAEGQRLRLDPAVDVDALRLHPVAAMVARAAQRYGFIVTDRAGAVAVVGETPLPGRPDPWTAALGRTPTYEVLRGFPWQRLQVLPRDLGKPSRQ